MRVINAMTILRVCSGSSEPSRTAKGIDTKNACAHPIVKIQSEVKVFDILDHRICFMINTYIDNNKTVSIRAFSDLSNKLHVHVY